MNRRGLSPEPAVARRTCLAFALLLPALAAGVAQATAQAAWTGDNPYPPGSVDQSRPYLRFVGPPRLRFQEAAVPPEDVVARPPASGPATGPAAPPSCAIAEPARRPGAGPAVAAAPRPKPDIPAAAAPKPDATPAGPAAPPAPPPILQDDAARKVRAEDFLPFFQFPENRPPPGEMPPSSATYIQTK
jgi:hypothetical protein